jgi:HAAS domain-containing protein
MTPDMKTADTIDRYLLRFRLALTGVRDKEELVSEIRSHIVEKLEDHSRPIDDVVEQTLSGLGAPEVLATRYRTEGLLERASTTMSPLLLLRATMRWAMTGIRGFFAFWVLFLGYFAAGAFYVCAILKPFFPNDIGFWVGAHGASMGSRPTGAGEDIELLGMWFAPVALALGCLCIIGTTKFVRWMISKRRRTATTTAPA